MAGKKDNKKLKEAKISPWLYHFYIPLFHLFGKLRYGLKIDKTDLKGKKGPFLVLGNHTAWVDFLYFAKCVYPRPLNFVVASNIFYRPFLRYCMTRYGAIPKKQFVADLNCIKLIKRFMDNGTSILLFPEGRITVDGTTGYISPTIGKLVKWLGYPVVAGITEGSYMMRPKWGNKRNGRVHLTMKEILTKEDIEKMSAPEIAAFIKEKFVYNDNESFIERKGKLIGWHQAEYLEKILYKCPSCGREFTMHSDHREFICDNCGNTVIFGTDGALHKKTEKDICFDTVSDWYAYQRNTLAEEIKVDNYSLSEKVVLERGKESEKEFFAVGEGELTVDNENITYAGTIDGEQSNLVFKIKNHPILAFKLGRDVEIAEDENIYRFVFEKGLVGAKVNLAVEELYKKNYESQEK